MFLNKCCHWKHEKMCTENNVSATVFASLPTVETWQNANRKECLSTMLASLPWLSVAEVVYLGGDSIFVFVCDVFIPDIVIELQCCFVIKEAVRKCAL